MCTSSACCSRLNWLASDAMGCSPPIHHGPVPGYGGGRCNHCAGPATPASMETVRPAGLAIGVAILGCQRVWQKDLAASFAQIRLMQLQHTLCWRSNSPLRLAVNGICRSLQHRQQAQFLCGRVATQYVVTIWRAAHSPFTAFAGEHLAMQQLGVTHTPAAISDTRGSLSP